jgi:hypothetical protein
MKAPMLISLRFLEQAFSNAIPSCIKNFFFGKNLAPTLSQLPRFLA